MRVQDGALGFFHCHSSAVAPGAGMVAGHYASYSPFAANCTAPAIRAGQAQSCERLVTGFGSVLKSAIRQR